MAREPLDDEVIAQLFLAARTYNRWLDRSLGTREIPASTSMRRAA